MKTLMRTLTLGCFFLACGSASAGEWTQFRGAAGTGASAESNLPVKWALSKDKNQSIRWSADLPGRGLSGVVVAGGKAYVTACDGPGTLQPLVP